MNDAQLNRISLRKNFELSISHPIISLPYPLYTIPFFTFLDVSKFWRMLES